MTQPHKQVDRFNFTQFWHLKELTTNLSRSACCTTKPSNHYPHSRPTLELSDAPPCSKRHLTTLPDLPSSAPLQRHRKCLQHDSFTSPLLVLCCLRIPLLVSFLRISRKYLRMTPFSCQTSSASHNGNIARKGIYSMSEQ